MSFFIFFIFQLDPSLAPQPERIFFDGTHYFFSIYHYLCSKIAPWRHHSLWGIPSPGDLLLDPQSHGICKVELYKKYRPTTHRSSFHLCCHQGCMKCSGSSWWAAPCHRVIPQEMKISSEFRQSSGKAWSTPMDETQISVSYLHHTIHLTSDVVCMPSMPSIEGNPSTIAQKKNQQCNEYSEYTVQYSERIWTIYSQTALHSLGGSETPQSWPVITVAAVAPFAKFIHGRFGAWQSTAKHLTDQIR